MVCFNPLIIHSLAHWWRRTAEEILFICRTKCSSIIFFVSTENIALICVLICIHYYLRLNKNASSKNVAWLIAVRCCLLHFLKLCLFVYFLQWSQGIVLFCFLWLSCEWAIVDVKCLALFILCTDKCIRHRQLRHWTHYNSLFFECTNSFLIATKV